MDAMSDLSLSMWGRGVIEAYYYLQTGGFNSKDLIFRLFLFPPNKTGFQGPGHSVCQGTKNTTFSYETPTM
jgi:hypothetical protein